MRSLVGFGAVASAEYSHEMVNDSEQTESVTTTAEVGLPLEELRRLVNYKFQRPATIGEKDLIKVLIKEEAINANEDPVEFLRIADCESEFDPYAHNRSGSAGLYQFLPDTWNKVRNLLQDRSLDVYNPVDNIKGFIVWRKFAGKSQWVCG